MNIYQALFDQDNKAVSKTSKEFIQEFGQDTFANMIFPYIKGGKVWLISYAPRSRQTMWFILRLGQNTATNRKDTLEELPVQSLDVEETVLRCRECDLPIVVDEHMDKDNPVCGLCWSKSIGYP